MWGTSTSTHVPDQLYRSLPVVYVAAGLATLSQLTNIYGIVSGILFITAGVLVLTWRGGKQRKKQGRRPSRRSRSPKGGMADALEYPARRPTTQVASPAPAPAPAPEPGPEPDECDQGDRPSFNDGDPVTSELLSRFSPFRELNDSLRRMFVGNLTISRKPHGSSLIRRGSEDDTTIYLLEGTLLLTAVDGREIHVAAGTSRACRPLCMLRPHVYSVTSLTDVAVIILSQEMVNEVTRIVAKYKDSPAIHVP